MLSTRGIFTIACKQHPQAAATIPTLLDACRHAPHKHTWWYIWPYRMRGYATCNVTTATQSALCLFRDFSAFKLSTGFFGVQEGHLEGKLHFHSVQREMGHRKITWAVVAVTFGSTGKPSLP